MGLFSAWIAGLRGNRQVASSDDSPERVLRSVQDYMALNGSVPSVGYLRDELHLPIDELRAHLEDIVRQWTLARALSDAAPPVRPIPAQSPVEDEIDELLTQILGGSAKSDDQGASGTDAAVEISAEVFFNARHSLMGEWDGEVHAHTWKLMVSASSADVLDGLNAERLREVLQSLVAPYEGSDLDSLPEMLGFAPTLERVAVRIERAVRREVRKAGGQVQSITFWDKPTTSVTLRRSSKEATEVDAIQSLG